LFNLKIYESESKKKKGKKALNGLNLVLQNNEIFGLLGPNGAGKTTFFSLLTGIYEPTSGNAFVGGYSIRDKIEKVQELIGYCPQFDLLWNDLSVEEHLYFYSRLKNVHHEQVKKNVEKTLHDIRLDNFRGFLVKELSGGMKRRLSLGISIVGNPSIVFLDEPSTGLDPENKRQIWEILSNCKEGKCMILTTHLMEEAEVLSDRIGIIVNGSLKCLGSQYKIKKVYGKGFKLVINLTSYTLVSNKQGLNEEEYCEDRMSQVIGFIKELFPNSLLHENFKNTLIFEVFKI
jgi:ABC-type multidrug transport system ATPase subunit